MLHAIVLAPPDTPAMLPPGLNTAREVKQHYEDVYESLIASGQYHPFLYPWATIGFGVVLVYLLIDHRQSPTLKSLRIPLFGFLCAFSTWVILTNKARSPAASYGVGLLSAWGTLWTAAIMCFNDCQTDFKRIDRNEEVMSEQNGDLVNGSLANGSVKADSHVDPELSAENATTHQGGYYWQSYPVRLTKRLDWTLDLFSNFRGIGWTFETNGIPPLPAHIEAELNGKAPNASQPPTTIQTSKTGIRRFTNPHALLKDVLLSLTIGYIVLDLVKTLMHHDPYFWGYTNAPPPLYLPQTIRSSPTLTRSYRLLVSLVGIYTALNEILRLGPLLFACVLGPSSILGVRGEAFMNPPDFYGSLSTICDHGLAGWWAAWWHQTFRFAFQAPATWLLQTYHIPPRSARGKVVSLFVAFLLSGWLHACGSHAQLGETRPVMGAFRFFLLQPLGILAQRAAAQALQNSGVTEKTPRVLRRLANFALTHVWLYYTAPLLMDDFAQGGIWLYEPVAFSPLRALGFGAEDDNGWDLWYGLMWWRQGDGWWDTGIAF